MPLTAVQVALRSPLPRITGESQPGVRKDLAGRHKDHWASYYDQTGGRLLRGAAWPGLVRAWAHSAQMDYLDLTAQEARRLVLLVGWRQMERPVRVDSPVVADRAMVWVAVWPVVQVEQACWRRQGRVVQWRERVAAGRWSARIVRTDWRRWERVEREAAQEPLVAGE